MLADLSIVLLLLLLNAFFAMAELAIVSARRARLRQMVEEKRPGADVALALAEDPTSFLSIVQIGITLNSILAGAFSGTTLAAPLAEYLNAYPYIYPYGDAVAMGSTVVVVSYFSLVIGELLPKRIGLSYAEEIAVRVARLMRFLSIIAAPVVWLLKVSTEFLLRLLGLNNPTATPVTEDEVKDLIAEGTEIGVFKQAEKEMLEGVMRLADRSVRTIMTPRIDMVWLGAEESPEKQAETMHSSGYSRFPVGRGDLDEVVGIVHAKDILNAVFEGKKPSLADVMRPPLVVPDTTPVLRLLDQFKQSGQHLAVVIDEYGSVEGVVSVTDILVAITGELPETGQDSSYKPVRREDGSWLIDGMTPIDEVENLIGVKNLRDGGDFHTVAGFVIDRLGKIPVAGDHFHLHDARFEVVDMDGRRVDKVLIHPPSDQRVSEETELSEE